MKNQQLSLFDSIQEKEEKPEKAKKGRDETFRDYESFIKKFAEIVIRV